MKSNKLAIVGYVSIAVAVGCWALGTYMARMAVKK